MSGLQAYLLEAKLVPWGPFVPPRTNVSRTIVMREDQTFAHLSLVLRGAFGWWMDDHLYAFWPDGEFWGEEPAFLRPYELEEAGKDGRSAELPLSEAGLEAGSRLAYIFDFGDEWRVLLTVSAVEPADGGGYPRVLPGKGDPPPQYPPLDDED